MKISIFIWTKWKKVNLHWFCTQNHILEPFSVRRACTQCYVTSEPYPRPSQIWCQNVRETRKKIVIKCRGESFARCRVIARYVEGGPSCPPPPVFLGLNMTRLLYMFHCSFVALCMGVGWIFCYCCIRDYFSSFCNFINFSWNTICARLSFCKKIMPQVHTQSNLISCNIRY